MGFLNKEKITKNLPIIHFTKSSLDGGSSCRSKEENKNFEIVPRHNRSNKISNLKQPCAKKEDEKNQCKAGHKSLRASFKRPGPKPISFINEDKNPENFRIKSYLRRRRNSDHEKRFSE